MARHLALINAALMWLAYAVIAPGAEAYNGVPSKDQILHGEDLEPASLQPYAVPPYAVPPYAVPPYAVTPYAIPPYARLMDDEAFWKKDLLLFKLMKSLKQAEPYGDEVPEYEYTESSWPEALNIKEDVKRGATSLDRGASSQPTKAEAARHQRKGKIKNGKGFPSLCYFKLCSFRRV